MFERVGRDEAMKEAYKVMATRLQERAWSKDECDRRTNPLAATLATPGGGKSFFLDELAALRHDDLEKLCSDQGMRKILQNSVSYK